MRLIWTTMLILFGAFMVTIVCLKNAGMGAPFFAFFGQIPYHDKVGHFILMGILGFLAVAAITPRLRLPPKTAFLPIMAGLISIIGLEELSQGLLPQRTLSLSDFLFGVAGALIFGWIAIHVPPSSPKPTESKGGESLR